MISFQCKTKDIKATLTKLKGLHKHKHIIGIKATCEITLTDENVQLAIPGDKQTQLINLTTINNEANSS